MPQSKKYKLYGKTEDTDWVLLAEESDVSIIEGSLKLFRKYFPKTADAAEFRLEPPEGVKHEALSNP